MARRNVEAEEHAMDMQLRHSEIIAKTDLYDSVQDARSEARYADDPQAEPDTREVADTVARMGLGDAAPAAERLIYRG